MMKLSHAERINHLQKPENNQLKKKWKNLTKGKSEEIFDLLNTDQELDTTFERRYTETYFGMEQTRYYTNYDFYLIKKTIKDLRGKTKQNYETDDFFIKVHKLILTLNEAKSTQQTAISPQILLDSDNIYWQETGDKGIAQWYLKIFIEQKSDSPQIQKEEVWNISAENNIPITPNENLQENKDTDDYSDWLRQN